MSESIMMMTIMVMMLELTVLSVCLPVCHTRQSIYTAKHISEQSYLVIVIVLPFQVIS